MLTRPREKPFRTLDEVALNCIRRLDHPAIHSLWRGLSMVGDKGLVWLVFIAWQADHQRSFRLFTFGLLAMGMLYLLVDKVIKPAVARHRPTPSHHATESDFSFPSGHAASASMTLTWLYTLVVPSVWTVILTYGALTVLSRAALGRHYISDIIGGALIGGFVGGLLIWLY